MLFITLYNTFPHFHFSSTIMYLSNAGNKGRLQLFKNGVIRKLFCHATDTIVPDHVACDHSNKKYNILKYFLFN